MQTVKGAATLLDVTYTLDPVGNPLTEVTAGPQAGTKTFTYDASDRLSGVCFQAGTCPGGSDPFIRWTYDKVGNRLSEQRPTGTTAYAYDARDRLLSAGPTSYTWDQNGNELSAGSRTFVYDLANRLKSTTLAPTTTTYTYDGDGIRTQASTGTTNQSKTNFTWDVNHPLPEIVREASGADSLYRRYVHGLQTLWMLQTATNTSANHFHYDPLGSTRAVTAQGGATQRTYDYDPFGSTRATTGTLENLHKFAGEYEDPTGLYHLRARQYDPVAGRFLHLDPLDADESQPFVSAYAYVANVPTRLIDPSGARFQPSNRGLHVAYFTTSTADERYNPWKYPPERFVLRDDMVVYRAYGGRARRVRPWVTPEVYGSPEAMRQRLSLLPSNSAQFITVARIPKGTAVLTGIAAEIKELGLRGGGSQIFILGEVKPVWFKKGVVFVPGWQIKLGRPPGTRDRPPGR